MFKRAVRYGEAETMQKLWKSRPNFSGVRRTDWDTGKVEVETTIQIRKNRLKTRETGSIPEEDQVQGVEIGISEDFSGLETLLITLEQETSSLSLETDTLETLFQTLNASLFSEQRLKETLEKACLTDEETARETMEEIAGVQKKLETERSKLTAIANDDRSTQIYIDTVLEQCRCIEVCIGEVQESMKSLTEQVSLGEYKAHILKTQVADIISEALLVETEAKTDQLSIVAATDRLNDFLSLNS